MEKMAVLVASGSYLPKGLTFGPTNGPEDFQEFVFIAFFRKLYKEWFFIFGRFIGCYRETFPFTGGTLGRP